MAKSAHCRTAPRRARAGAGVRRARPLAERSHRRQASAQRRHRRRRSLPTTAPPSPNSRVPCAPSRNRSSCRCKVELYSDMQQTGMPGNFNDLRLNAAIQLEAACVGSQGNARTSPSRTSSRRAASTTAKSSACSSPSPATAPPKPRARFRSILNDRVVETKSVDVPESGRATRRVPLARSALRPQQRRGQDRFRRRAARRRRVQLLGGARRPAARALRLRGRQPALASLFQSRARSLGTDGLRHPTGHGRNRPPTSTRRSMPSSCSPM